jgi:hypothetical protein
MLGEVEAARIFVGKGFFPFPDRHLTDLLGLFGAGHLDLSFDRREYATVN